MSSEINRKAAQDLTDSLALGNAPLAIHFTDTPIDGVAPFTKPMPGKTDDGRTGRVPAGCVFWMKSADKTFSTIAEDHANCSVGSVTHGLKTLEEAAEYADVETLVSSGWVSPEIFPEIPVIKKRHQYITYGPLADAKRTPDVVLLRVNAKQAMHISDALPQLRFEGKPQCHIIPIAKEQQHVAISVGCMLSRTRTGMPNTEMTCAIPGEKLTDIARQIKTTVATDANVARYASEDAKRF